MQPPLHNGVPTAPRFYITSREPLSARAILLATVAALSALSSVVYAMGHTGHSHLTSNSARSPNATSNANSADDEKDDPSQIDTIELGDPADAPVPARRGDHVSPVHPTILVRLPRFGEQVGLIPDTPAGHLLYAWLAAFNQASYPALGNALPNFALASAASAQMELRRQTGASTSSLPKRSSPASSSSGSATRPRQRLRLSAPSRCARTPTPPPSRASASVPFPHSVTTPPRATYHSRHPHRGELQNRHCLCPHSLPLIN
jgi:hypothetical protein